MSSEVVVRTHELGKCYHIYDRPSDRLKQTLFRGRRQFYREFWALRGVSLEVSKGQSVGIIGRNGSGKSTLLQLLAGTLTRTTGDISIHGRVSALLELGTGFNPEFTGRENVFLNGAILGISREEMESRFDAIARFADIGDFIDQPTKTYSSGMLVRLAFSVSINVDPEILIVDEALAVGDAGFKFKCLERLEDLTASGVTLLFVSHSTEEVKTFCNHAMYLEGGVVKARGSPEEVTELYLYDVRAEQQRSRGAASGLVLKAPLYSAGRSAYGTDDARIISAQFADGRGQSATFASGDEIAVVIEAEYRGSIRDPHLTILLQDARMMQIGGRAFPLQAAGTRDDFHRVRIHCSFPARFNGGQYFITLRLEDRRSGDLFFPLEKQSGLMSFAVERRPKEYVGVVDLDMHIQEVAFEASTV